MRGKLSLLYETSKALSVKRLRQMHTITRAGCSEQIYENICRRIVLFLNFFTIDKKTQCNDNRDEYLTNHHKDILANKLVIN